MSDQDEAARIVDDLAVAVLDRMNSPIGTRLAQLDTAAAAIRAYGADQARAAAAAKDGAYFERNQLVAALTKLYPAGIAKTAIPGWSDDWHGCVYIDLPTGQVSWHFHDSQAALFAHLPPYVGTWDGHDTPEKYRRLDALPASTEAAARVLEGWKPIETAPKNRVRVLLTSTNYHYQVVGYHSPWEDSEPAAWRADWDNESLEDDPHYNFRPTHWMPLPAPLQPEPGKEGTQPLTNYQRNLVREDRCPRCRGQLDTGWECLDCGYDAEWIALAMSMEPEPGKEERT